MTPPTQSERDAARVAGEVAKRAIRRLDILEWVILLGAGGLATGGGALVAALVAEPLGVPYRSAWMGLSLFLFVVPGAIVLLRHRREERASAEESARNDGPSDG